MSSSSESLFEFSSWEELSSLLEGYSSAAEGESSAIEEASSGEESSAGLYEELILERNAPFGYDAILIAQGVGGSFVQLTYDIRAKCKWDRVIDFADVAAVKAALDDILVLARKSLRPRVPSREYDQHVIDITNFINGL